MDDGWTAKRGEGMSHYRRLISYIYAYEGSVKGKNIGYAKIEIRGGQCRIQANVKHVYVGGGEIGVYLLTPGEELLLGRIFIRNGAGEYRTQVNPDDIDGSGCRIDQCYGLTIHDVENAWQCWTTIWEDAVAQTAELELADVTAENQRKIDEEQRTANETEANQIDEGEIHKNQIDEKETNENEINEKKNNEPEIDENEIEVEQPEADQPEPDQPNEGQSEMTASENLTQDQADLDENSEQMDADLVEQTDLVETDETVEQKPENENPQNLEEQGAEFIHAELPISSEIERELNAQEERQANSTQNTLSQVDTVARLMAGIRTAISGSGTASGLLSSAIRTVQNVAMENNFGDVIQNERDSELSKSDLLDSQKSESKKQEKNVLEEKLKERWKETKKNAPQEGEHSKNTQKNDEKNQKNDDKKREKKPAETEPFPELENSDFLRELDRLERENNGADHLWQQLQRRYVRVLAFDYEKGCEILSIRPQDIGLLPREIWHYGNNSFLLHGYYNYRHLILARMNNPQGPYRYLLGVPGHYFSNEKYLASMFGFPHFVLARKQPDQDGRFGYWYTEIRL